MMLLLVVLLLAILLLVGWGLYELAHVRRILFALARGLNISVPLV